MPLPTSHVFIVPSSPTSGHRTLKQVGLIQREHATWIRLFNRRAESATSVGFQIANCEADNAGVVTLCGIEYLVEAHQTLTQFLFFRFTSGKAKLYQRTRTLALSAENRQKLSAKVSQKVLDKLADNILSFDL
jgi:hypothetical protein